MKTDRRMWKEVKSERLVRRRAEISEMKRKEKRDGVNGYHSAMTHNHLGAFNFMFSDTNIFHLCVFRQQFHLLF